MFLLDMAFFFIFVFVSFAIVVIHRSHALHNTTRKGQVDGTYWGAYSHSVKPAPVVPAKDHGPRVVNGKLVLPKVIHGGSSALAGKSTYAGKR